MKLEDIKIGMKVKLLGKHTIDDFDNIEDWFEDYYNEEDVQQIKEQGYGVVTYIDEHGNNIWVSECENGTEYFRFHPHNCSDTLSTGTGSADNRTWRSVQLQYRL